MTSQMLTGQGCKRMCTRNARGSDSAPPPHLAHGNGDSKVATGVGAQHGLTQWSKSFRTEIQFFFENTPEFCKLDE